jgi:hypothetical protein
MHSSPGLKVKFPVPKMGALVHLRNIILTKVLEEISAPIFRIKKDGVIVFFSKY